MSALTDALRIIDGTADQLLEIHAATPSQSNLEGIARQAPGSKPPCDLDRLDRIAAEERQVRHWSNRWGFVAGNLGERIRYLSAMAHVQDESELQRLVDAWGPVRRVNENRWPIVKFQRSTWIGYDEAVRVSGRNKRTLIRWRKFVPDLTVTSLQGEALFHRGKLMTLAGVTPTC